MNKEYCTISDSDIPSGSGGINGERYTYGQLRHQPIIPEVLRRITNPRSTADGRRVQRAQ